MLKKSKKIIAQLEHRKLIKMASKGGNTEVLDLLCRELSRDKQVDKQQLQSSLDWGMFKAAFYGQLDVVRYFCDNYPSTIDVSIKEEFGMTPLHIAAQNGHSDVAELLCDRSGEWPVETKLDTVGLTPLSRAASCGNARLVKFLLKRAKEKQILPKVLQEVGSVAMVAASRSPEIVSDESVRAILSAIHRFVADFLKEDIKNGELCYVTVASCLSLLLDMSGTHSQKKRLVDAGLLTEICSLLAVFDDPYNQQPPFLDDTRPFAIVQLSLCILSNISEEDSLIGALCRSRSSSKEDKLIHLLGSLVRNKHDTRLKYDLRQFFAAFLLSRILTAAQKEDQISPELQRLFDDDLSLLVSVWVNFSRQCIAVTNSFCIAKKMLLSAKKRYFRGVRRFALLYANFLATDPDECSRYICILSKEGWAELLADDANFADETEDSVVKQLRDQLQFIID